MAAIEKEVVLNYANTNREIEHKVWRTSQIVAAIRGLKHHPSHYDGFSIGKRRVEVRFINNSFRYSVFFPTKYLWTEGWEVEEKEKMITDSVKRAEEMAREKINDNLFHNPQYLKEFPNSRSFH